MPKLGESITEGTILSWSVKVGDNVQEDDVLFEVSTAKVSAEIPSPIAGQVHDIFFAEGDTVAVGTVVATILPDDDDAKEEASEPAAAVTGEPQPAGDTSAAATSRADTLAEPAAATPAANAGTTTSPTPPASASVSGSATPHAATPTSGSASEASSGSGAGRETAPATDRWYSPVVLQLAEEAHLPKEELDRIPGTGFEGRLSKKNIQNYIRQKQNGQAAPVSGSAAGGPVTPTSPSGSMAAGTAATTGIKVGSQTQPAATAIPSAATSAGSASTPASGSTDQRTTAGPGTTSGPEARPASAKSAPATSLSPGDTRVEMDRVRRMIADHMVMSKQVSPHVTSVIEIDVSRLVSWRTRTKDDFFRREGIKLTYMPAIAEATARALAEYPQLNASVDGYSVILKKRINLGIAVSLDDGNLIVPVIPDADKLNLGGLASAIDTLAAKARHNKLAATDIQGGTFTITNFGTFKSLFGTPIINQPEVAILAVGYIEKKPAVIETPEGEAIAIRHKMYLSLSYDHRVIDGALGGSFLRRIGDLLENWNA